MKQVSEALELLSKPTKKNIGLAVMLLRSIPKEDDGSCETCHYSLRKYEPETKIVKLKTFICALCPKCGSKTFDLNTELMKGSCLSCSYKSSDYPKDMRDRKQSILK
jgi:hypothetical protein